MTVIKHGKEFADLVATMDSEEVLAMCSVTIMAYCRSVGVKRMKMRMEESDSIATITLKMRKKRAGQ